MPKPIPKPPRAEEVLAAVAARYPSGSTVTLPMIAEVGGVNLSTAGQIRQKGPNIAGLDPNTGRLTRLFNPRRQRWSAHFAWDGPLLVGKTAVGRTTLYVLNMNHPDRVELRRLLIAAGLFPP
jgi:hypothetical protein